MKLDALIFMIVIFGICLGGFIYALILSARQK
jgi:hypothetical protein